MRILINSKLKNESDRLGRSAALLDAVSPLAVLGRGYSITMTGPEERVVRDSKELSVGTDVSVTLGHGGFTAKVTTTKKA
jgi:exodeoxyribonuclease VII large subunit